MLTSGHLYFGTILLFFLLLYLYSRFKSTIRCLFFTASTGLASLGVLWGVGFITPLSVVPTPFSILVAAVLGVPGVIGMLLFHLL